MHSHTRGFTLVELLVVVVIIGVLAAITINIINITAQRQRANESVTRANVGKICGAISSCFSTQTSFDTNTCDDWAELGAIEPSKPDSAVYSLTDKAGSETAADGYVLVTGTTDSCTIGCFLRNDLGSDTISGVTSQSGQVVNQTSNCLTE